MYQELLIQVRNINDLFIFYGNNLLFIINLRKQIGNTNEFSQNRNNNMFISTA